MGFPAQVLSARHRLLREIGDEGVQRLASARVTLDPALSEAAARTARGYLERAGMHVSGAGEGANEGAAFAHLRGAHAALESIAQEVGVRRGPPLPLAALCAVLDPSPPAESAP